jgi:pimeloyl-ACP methyl ester carboxylesterase
VQLTLEKFKYAFGNELSEEESAELYRRWAIPGPARVLFQAAFANLVPHSPAEINTGNDSRGPLLLIAGEKDHTVPPVVTRWTYKLYRHSPAVTELVQMPGRGHSLTIDHGWREVADTSLHWLRGHVQ